ncbi:MAG: carboxylating nicotinate-nucleotide diphosphorylase [Actinomycetota bacterium]|nr:carboxylating nicotinate-nucleotide diphosphorylase [Actinomycetota bacterium]
MSGSDVTPLHRLLWEPVVRAALAEDLGVAGDLTTDALVPVDHRSTFAVVSRADGVVAGVDAAVGAFTLVDPSVSAEVALADGQPVAAGERVLTVSGPSRALLTAERTALNVLCRMSGIASTTRRMVDAVEGTGASIVCTRKTTPGLRALEKHAVRAGGGANHRFGLDDAVLIKDNHIAVAGSIAESLRRARERVGHLVKIEIEVDGPAQLDEVLADGGADVVLLDNFSPDELRKAVEVVDGRLITEASGGITPQTVRGVADAGVDLISVGWITHSAPILDLGLDTVA